MVAQVEHKGVTYTVIDKPENFKYIKRTDFIESLCGVTPAIPRALEDILRELSAQLPHNRKVKVSERTMELALSYTRFRDQGARLPKFSKWATGMFKDDKNVAADLAAAGKLEDSSGNIIISSDIMDLLRNADTPHFSSCLRAGGTYDSVTKGIVEHCPGIAIAYVDDADGKMRGRCWVHHAVRVDNGNTVAVVCTKWGGTLDASQVVKTLRERGFEAYQGGSYGKQYDGHDAIKVNFVNCFTKALHHDMYTWIKDFKVSPA